MNPRAGIPRSPARGSLYSEPTLPADWQTSQTFEESLIRLAVAAGMANYDGQEAALPDDPLHLDRLKRAYNDGYERFLRHRARWTFMEMPFELTTTSDGTGAYNVEGDPARYALPDFLIGCRPKGNWHYTDSSAIYSTVIDTSWEIVRARYASHGNDAGVPQIAACQRMSNPADSINNADRWEVIFWPPPGAVYTLTALFSVMRRRLVELTEKHPAGMIHDATINACAKFEFFKDDSGPLREPAVLEMGEALDRSVQIDLQNEPKRLGRIRDPGLATLLDSGRVRRYDRTGVSTYNGVSIL